MIGIFKVENFLCSSGLGYEKSQQTGAVLLRTEYSDLLKNCFFLNPLMEEHAIFL